MRKHLNLIQFSRVIIPLFVVLFHVKAFMNHYFHYNFLGLPDVSKSGGVYYFFSLSGFMAYYLYHQNFGTPSYIKDFLYSRVIRIYPVYWFLTLLILPIYFFLPSLGFENDRGLVRIVTSFLLLPHQSQPLIGVAWSLVHTMFFYLVFCLFFLKDKLFPNVIIFIWSILSVLIGFNLVPVEHYLIQYIFNVYNLMFLLGILCAQSVLKRHLTVLSAWFYIFTGIFIFPLAWVNEQFHWIRLDFQMIILLATMLIMLGFASIDLQRDVKLPKMAMFLGDASFSIYLTHYYTGTLISLFITKWFSKVLPNALVAMILIITSIISGCIVYVLVEKPIHTRLKRYRKRKMSH